MKRRKFTFEDQKVFAKFSGDYNPVHTDSVLARRTIFGRPIVHGIHAVLWALDQWLEGHTNPLELRTIKVNFRTAIGVEEEVDYSAHGKDNNRVEIKLLTRGASAVWIQLDWALSERRGAGRLPAGYPEHRECRLLTIEEARTASGSLDLNLNLKRASELFPNLIRVLPPMQIAEILATSRLVGMECLGRHSIYFGLDLAFSTAEVEESCVLDYKVTSCNARASLVLINVEAPGVKGTIKAFLSPAPQEQASYMDLQRLVEADEFAGQRSLVIGGSRGLGEVTAKLLAAGGAEVKITYYQGTKDAHCIVGEITAGGGTAECLFFDVLNPPQDLAKRLGKQWTPTYLYYFATPPIFAASKGTFLPQLFKKFCDYYVTGFLNAIRTLHNLGDGLQKIFYPSSVAIDDTSADMGEYAAAKTAGEVLCAFLEKTNSGLKIHKPRLPRLATDQTISILSMNNRDPVPLMLENLRYLRDI